MATVAQPLPSLSSTTATRRLARDLQEVLRNASFLPFIRALPVKENLFLWHANLAGPPNTANADVLVHLELKFPTTYPKEPPCVRICNETFRHPNVFSGWNPAAYGEFKSYAPGNWICVDILKPFVEEAYTGWSSSYTVFSILVQLQAFLFDGDGEWTKITTLDNATKQASRSHHCQLCGHYYNRPWPSVRIWKPTAVKQSSPSTSVGSTRQRPLQFTIQEPTFPTKEDKGEVIGDDKKLTPSQTRNKRRTQARKLKALQQQSLGKNVKGQEVQASNTKKKNKKKRVSNSMDLGQKSQVVPSPRQEQDTDGKQSLPQTKEHSQQRSENKQSVTEPFTISKVGGPEKSKPPVNSGYFSVLMMTPGQISALKSNPVTAATTPAKPSRVPLVLRPNHKKKPLQKPPIVRKPSVFDRLPVEVVGKILDFLDRRSQARAVQVCHLWDYLINYRIIAQEMICFHTKLPYTEAVLGIGLNLEYYPASKRINQITSPLDLISKSAFYDEGVTKSVWKIQCSHWMPLFINDGHAKRAGIETYKSALARILGKTNFSPRMVLEVLPKLMNTMVVQTMNGTLHTSIVALEGYCAFHRLLLFFADAIPGVSQLAERRVEDFLLDPESRIKRNTSNLGEFLVLLAITRRTTWEDVRLPFLLESWDRNVKWMLEKEPSLGVLEPQGTLSKTRLELTMTHSAVSQRLLMFQVYFLTNIARPKGSRLADVKAAYDRRFGRPSESTKVTLQQECKKIKAVSTWPEFFTRLGFTAIPGPTKVCDLLRQSVVNSKKKGYHGKKI